MKESLTIKTLGIEIDLPIYLIAILVLLALVNALLWGGIGIYTAIQVIV